MSSKEINLADKNLLVNNVTPLNIVESPSISVRRTVDAKLLRRDMSSLYNSLRDMANDRQISPAEKRQLKIIKQQADAEYATAIAKLEEFGYEGFDIRDAHESLSEVLIPIFANMSEAYLMPAGFEVAPFFEAFYIEAQRVDETIYSFTTGILNGIDNRTKFLLTIIGNVSIPEGGSTELSVSLFEDGIDVTNNPDWANEDFTWQIKGKTNIVHGKSVILSESDLVNGSLVVYCTFKHYTNINKTIYYYAFDWENVGKAKQGPQGPQGEQGPQGGQGEAGADGKSSYLMIQYARGNDEEVTQTGTAVGSANMPLGDGFVFGEETTWSDTIPQLRDDEVLWSRQASIFDNSEPNWNVFRISQKKEDAEKYEIYLESDTGLRIYCKAINLTFSFQGIKYRIPLEHRDNEKGVFYKFIKLGLADVINYGTGYVACVRKDVNGIIAPSIEAVRFDYESTPPNWCLYEDRETLADVICVLGRFDIANLDVETFSIPRLLETCISSDFLKLMKDIKGDIDNVQFQTFAKALGIDQIFKKLAVFTAYIGELFSNYITITNTGALASDDFDKDNKKGFFIGYDEGQSKIIINRGEFSQITIDEMSTLKGTVDTEYFKTNSSSNPPVSETQLVGINFDKVYWNESNLYSLINPKNMLIPLDNDGRYSGTIIQYVMCYSNTNQYATCFSTNIDTLRHVYQWDFPFTGSAYIKITPPTYEGYETESEGVWTEIDRLEATSTLEPDRNIRLPSFPDYGDEAYINDNIRYKYDGLWHYDLVRYRYEEVETETPATFNVPLTLRINNVLVGASSHTRTVRKGDYISIETAGNEMDTAGKLEILVSFPTTGVKFVSGSGRWEEAASNQWYAKNLVLELNGNRITQNDIATEYRVGLSNFTYEGDPVITAMFNGEVDNLDGSVDEDNNIFPALVPNRWYKVRAISGGDFNQIARTADGRSLRLGKDGIEQRIFTHGGNNRYQDGSPVVFQFLKEGGLIRTSSLLPITDDVKIGDENNKFSTIYAKNIICENITYINRV